MTFREEADPVPAGEGGCPWPCVHPRQHVSQDWCHSPTPGPVAPWNTPSRAHNSATWTLQGRIPS